MGRQPAALSTLGFAFGKAGHKAEAEEILDEIENRILAEGKHFMLYKSLVQTGLEKEQEALASLELATKVAASSLWALEFYRRYFDSLVSEPRFQKVLEDIGLGPWK
jgi:hypothetical protein